MKVEQNTWLPGVRPEPDWDSIPIDSIWERPDGLAFKILSIRKEDQLVIITRMRRDACGYVPVTQGSTHAYCVFVLINKLPNFTRVS